MNTPKKVNIDHYYRFNYVVGTFTLIVATLGILAYVSHQKTKGLKNNLLKTQNEIAELKLQKERNDMD